MNTYTQEQLLDEFQDECIKHRQSNARELYEEIMDRCSYDDAHDALDDYLEEFR